MLPALLIQRKAYPTLLLDMTESLPKRTVLLDGQLSFSSLQISLRPSETHKPFEITCTPGRC